MENIELKQAELDQRESRLNLMEKDLIEKATELDKSKALVAEQIKKLNISTEEEDYYDFVKVVNMLHTKYIYHRGNSEGFIDAVSNVLAGRKVYRNEITPEPPRKK